jgi:hypothetical protein
MKIAGNRGVLSLWALIGQCAWLLARLPLVISKAESKLISKAERASAASCAHDKSSLKSVVVAMQDAILFVVAGQGVAE